MPNFFFLVFFASLFHLLAPAGRILRQSKTPPGHRRDWKNGGKKRKKVIEIKKNKTEELGKKRREGEQSPQLRDEAVNGKNN